MAMTDPDLESRVVATLRAKGAQVAVPPEAFDPHLGRLTLAGPRRPRRRVVLVAAVVGLVLAVGIGVTVLLRDQGTVEPTGPPTGPVSQLQVIALPELRFQADEFTTEPGRNEIQFSSAGGTHGLEFEDPALAEFRLDSWDSPERGTVDLIAGRDYTIYCPIPGHRAAGLEAVIHVTDGPPGPTKGKLSALFGTSAGPPASAQVLVGPSQRAEPDYVAIGEHEGRPVYVKRLDFLPPVGAGRVPAYAEDLTTVVGHRDPMRGFILLGTDPESRPEVVATTTPPTTVP